jgi:hypothetical protein
VSTATLTRAELVAVVERVADDENVAPGLRAKLVAAVSDPAVTRVARGSYSHDGARCPAALAGLQYEPGAIDFAYRFDDLTADLTANSENRWILEVTP